MINIIEIPKFETNFEQTVKAYFQKIGYKITRGVTWSRKNGYNQSGSPDFYVQSQQKNYWVEAKDINDGLQVSQIIWISKYPNEIIYIAVPSGIPKKYWSEDFPIVFNQKNLDSIEDLLNEKKRLEREIATINDDKKLLYSEYQEMKNDFNELIRIHPLNPENKKFIHDDRHLYYIEDEKYQNFVQKKYDEFRNKYLWIIADTTEMGMSMGKKVEVNVE